MKLLFFLQMVMKDSLTVKSPFINSKENRTGFFIEKIYQSGNSL